MKSQIIKIYRDRRGGFLVEVKGYPIPSGVKVYPQDVDEFAQEMSVSFDGIRPVQIIEAFSKAEEYGEAYFQVLANTPDTVIYTIQNSFSSIKEDKVMRKENVIEIKEEVSIVQEDGTRVILEKGDKVQVLKEGFDSNPRLVNYFTKENMMLSNVIGSIMDAYFHSLQNGYAKNRQLVSHLQEAYNQALDIELSGM